ncbi:tyrosine-type recombinase/integrase [Chroococcidiopsis sp [FACHB-1243]]|uniref:tyrosine-type recombinase/integrase n=1 Tax=Chroococcidiopsis sp. [FACHB-1243] TaxID=2692781 RepID=UPI0018F00A28
MKLSLPTMSDLSSDNPILPIVIVPLDGGRQQEQLRQKQKDTLADLRHWQIEEFLRQMGKAENTQRSYRQQLKKFIRWCNKSWLDVSASDLGKYRVQLKQQGLKPTSINHALDTLRSFYQWLRRSNGFPVNQPLPTDAIGKERLEEPQALDIDKEDMAEIWHFLDCQRPTGIRDRAIVAILSHGLRASELSALDVKHWNGKRLLVHRSKGQNVSEVPLSREARQHLKAYLEWRRSVGGIFTPTSDRPMFLCQDPKHSGERLGYNGLYKMVKKVAASATIEELKPHHFRHSFGNTITRAGVDPLYGKELMGIKTDKVYRRYTQGSLKLAAAQAYLRAIGEDEGNNEQPEEN